MSKRKCPINKKAARKKSGTSGNPEKKEGEEPKTPWDRAKQCVDEIVAYGKKEFTTFEPTIIQVKERGKTETDARYLDPDAGYYVSNADFDKKYRCRWCDKCYREEMENRRFIVEKEVLWMFDAMPLCPQCTRLIIGMFVVHGAEQIFEDEVADTLDEHL